jgi:hypothetical protein
MPAIQPAILRQQAVLLAEYFDEPNAFVRSFHHLLEYYSDRARRPGQSGLPPPLMPSYHVRPPVLRQVLLELEIHVQDNPEAALRLCDTLWEEPFLEFRLLAISLLGKVSVQPPGPVIERLQTWMLSSLERRLVEELLEEGCKTLRSEQPDQYLDVIENWLSQTKNYSRQVGLQALVPLVKNPEFNNLPIVFRLIQPLILVISPALREDIVDIVRALTRRSPQESAYFLRQNLSHPEQKDIPFLIRKCAPEFPERIRRNLLDSIQDRKR